MSREYVPPARSGKSNLLRVAVTLRPKPKSAGPVESLRGKRKPKRKRGAKLAKPGVDAGLIRRAANPFKRLAFEVTVNGASTLSVRSNRQTFAL